MQLHNLLSTTRRRSKKRVGRGGKRGTTSGRGTKGQKSRAGRRIRPAIRDILKKIPKRRGYSQMKIPSHLLAVNLGVIAEHFEAGGVVSPKTLVDMRLVRRIAGKTPRVKVLGMGALTKPLEFKGFSFSKSAKEAIKKAGGKITS